ncbi:chitin disaccharide deacetylase [Marinisporobacter balticus]|uniref:Carbohydrate deacetylase n=1 Tax=Marinisporobacter balticus TaxID=2018667 RepID=A0A4R2KT26_9FIRM|nr:chitin disaccharide deacetylase [Marinisporobacter balticus]TCO76944.1 hypothetical protein EV214_107102 [Marinisporobacter balticus]
MITIKLIINADDFGYSKAVNFGIVECYKNGVVSSATLMTNMPGVEHAFELMKENPGLGVGIHLVLSAGRPICNDVSSLVDEYGKFQRREDLLLNGKIEDVEKEFASQMEKFLASGFKPTHIDSHHHVHRHEKVLTVVLGLAKKYKLPVRLTSENSLCKGNTSIKTTDFFTGKFYGNDLSEEKFLEIINVDKKYKTVEVMCHPAYVDNILLSGSAYNVQRIKEFAILTNPMIKRELEKRGINQINYRDI